MRINETNSYGGVTVEQAYALAIDQAFREEACVKQGATDTEVTSEPNDLGGNTVTIVRTMPADMPDFVKKFVGDTVKVKQVEQWSAADAAGHRSAQIRVSIIGQPAETQGTAVIGSADGMATLTFDGEVKVSIPFLGKKIEPEVARAIIASLRHDAELAAARAN